MKVRLDKDTVVRIEKNELNKGWKQSGMFQNRALIHVDGKEYYFYPSITGNEFYISKLFVHVPGSNVVKADEIIEMNKSYKLGKLKLHLVKYLLNSHRMNWWLFNSKKTVKERKRMLQAFGVAVIIALSYLFANLFSGNSVMEFMKTNVYIQSFLLFLSVIGIMKLYRPFAIVRGFSEQDARRIFEQMRKEEEEEKEARERASF